MEPRFGILGRTRLRVGDRFDDRWGYPKSRAVLAALLLHPRQSVPISALIEWIYPDGIGPEPGTFHAYSKRIKAALGHMEEPPELVSDRGAYRIQVDREEIDLFQFREASATAGSLVVRGDFEPAIDLITSALNLWDGEPLADLDGPRAHAWRYRTQTELLIPAHETLLRALSGLHRFDEMLQRLADIPDELMANLTLVKLRLEALHGIHRSAEATTYFYAQRNRLLADVGPDEADELTRFHDELLRRDPRPPVAVAESAVAQPPHTLPHDIPHFTGREVTLRQLDAILASTTGDVAAGAVVVLSGPPGVGKTSIAVHWAHRVADQFPDGRLYADLSGFASRTKVEPSEVVDGLLTAFGFSVERISTAAARAAKLRRLLSGRRVLVVLDNAQSAEHVAPLLDCLSSCVIVVTSRRKLSGLWRRGAASLIVSPLEDKKAIEWLAARIGRRAVREPDAVADLAAICDGSPLALRGVIDRVVSRRGAALREFVDELRDSQVLLGLGDEGDDSDGSVRTVYSWSYHDLPTSAQRLFRVLGLHPGHDIGLEAAAALAGQSRAATRRDLDLLINAHLLTEPESRGRYRFHDMLYRYAHERAADQEHGDERGQAERRMLNFYLRTVNNADRMVFPYRMGVRHRLVADDVEPIEFAGVDEAMDWCIRERANLSAAVRYSASRGLHEYVPPLVGAAGEILQRAGYFEDLLAALEIAVQSARAIGNHESESSMLGNLGQTCLLLGDFDTAKSYLQASDTRAEEIGYRIGSAVAKYLLARLHIERGEFDRGIQLHLVALDMLRRSDAKGLQLMAIYKLCEAYRRASNLHAAMATCRDGLWLAEQLGDEHAQAVILTERGASYYEFGDLATAKDCTRRALEIHERLRDAAQAGKTYNVLCAIHRDEGDMAEAERCANQALAHCRTARDARGQALAYDALGQLLSAQARSEEAHDAWSSSLAIVDDLGDESLAGAIRARLADLPHLPSPVPTTRTEPLVPDQQTSA